MTMMNAGRIPLEPGHRLDRYELLCPIAHGGMASVWLARFVGKHGFEKLVAIKTILPEYAADTRFQQMFLDEARIASGIEHVNVAQILDLGEQHEVLYIVMEWVDGDSLSKLHRAVEARHECLPLGITMRLLSDACGGLHAAHELADKTGKQLGVVHRDVSPQNVLVSTKGNAKLIDFGIAKALDRISGDTNAGLLKGKIQYMAPEQSRGGALDRRADVWAAGAVLYYLLSGRPPFDGENQLATLHMLTSGQPPPPLPTDIPPPVRDIVFRALAHDPKNRTASAAILQRELEQAMQMCNAYTTTTDVAGFVAKELGSRAEGRKQAIEVALAAAAARAGIHEQRGQTTVAPHPTHSSPLASTVAVSGHASSPGTPHPLTPHLAPTQFAGADNTMLAPAPGDHPVPPRPGMLAPHASSDPISQVSNATLGAAAVAYPQNSAPPSPPKKSSAPAIVAGVLILGLLFGGGAFAYKRPELRAMILHTGAPVATPQVAATSNAITSDVAPTAPPTSADFVAPIAPATGVAAANASASPVASTSSAAPIAKPPTSGSTGKTAANHDASSHDSSSSSHTSSKPAVAKPAATHSTDYGF